MATFGECFLDFVDDMFLHCGKPRPCLDSSNGMECKLQFMWLLLVVAVVVAMSFLVLVLVCSPAIWGFVVIVVSVVDHLVMSVTPVI